MKKETTPDLILEHIKLLKKYGKLDAIAKTEAIDALSEPDNPDLQKEFFEDQSPVMIDIALNGKPFSVPDETSDGPIRFAIADNGQPVGFYPHECHFLITGQTGCGKSTLLKIIFAQVLLRDRAMQEKDKKEERDEGHNGKNNLLAIR